MTIRTARIARILEKTLAPTTLSIRDDSHKHAGHAGNQGGSETHLHIVIQSRKFHGLSRLDRHRMVMQLLDAEFKNGLHAVSLEAKEL